MYRTWRARLTSRIAIASLLVAATLMAATPASALTDAKVTLDQETGGQPTRFTFVAMTDTDASIPSMDVAFPEGFDLTASRFDVVTLEGLRRVAVKPTGGPSGTTLKVRFDPPIAANSTLRIQIYDVVTPLAGGDYALKVTYAAESTGTGAPSVSQRTADRIGFRYVTPSASEAISRWLDSQQWVADYNSVKALGIFFKPQLIVQSVPALFMGWLLSIALVLLAFPLAIVGGLALAFMRMAKIPPVRWIAGLYINVIRGTPLFLQIFMGFIGLRIAGVRAPDIFTAVFILALNSSAYLAEIFRAGIQSIHKGQFEAASSLGMTYFQAMRFVIIPQTVKRVLPTMTSEFILLFKDTALFAAVGLFELMMRAQSIVARSGNLTPFVVAAVYYLLVTIPLINWVGSLEEKLAVSEHGHTPSEPKRRGGLFWRPATAGPIAELEVSVAEHESR